MKIEKILDLMGSAPTSLCEKAKCVGLTTKGFSAKLRIAAFLYINGINIAY
ncbi:MAG: hypothetical protein ACQESP_03110 [Candidatus Muiribacteriota bacterium]